MASSMKGKIQWHQTMTNDSAVIFEVCLMRQLEHFVDSDITAHRKMSRLLNRYLF